jgi:hypothetical protein
MLQHVMIRGSNIGLSSRTRDLEPRVAPPHLNQKGQSPRGRIATCKKNGVSLTELGDESGRGWL